MRRRDVALIPAGMLLAAGCSVGAREPGTMVPAEEVPRIGVEQAHAKVQAGQAVLVDVRSAEAYQRLRAAGALSLPLDEVEQSPDAALKALPTGKQAVLYCT
ncbi:MAG: rhodanese-like domain-containing protein [Chloroflexota bacterium]